MLYKRCKSLRQTGYFNIKVSSYKRHEWILFCLRKKQKDKNNIHYSYFIEMSKVHIDEKVFEEKNPIRSNTKCCS